MARSPSGNPSDSRDECAYAARVIDGVRLYQTRAGAIPALGGVSVDFSPRVLTAVVGPSGSGKSTLLRCIAGLDRLTSGEVYLGSVELGALPRRMRTIVRRQRVGVIFQDFNLHPGLDVERNIALPSVIAGRELDRSWVDAVITRLQLSDLLHRRPAELSGGELQRVAAARALAGRPSLVLADEPTGNLDARSGRALLDVLRLVVDELDQTVILVTHDVPSACIGDQVVVLNDGKLVAIVDAPTIDVVSELVLRPSSI